MISLLTWCTKGALVKTRAICIEAVTWMNDNRGPEIVAATATLTVLATIAVILRFLARRIAKAPYGIDDWLILVALVSFFETAFRKHNSNKARSGNTFCRPSSS